MLESLENNLKRLENERKLIKKVKNLSSLSTPMRQAPFFNHKVASNLTTEYRLTQLRLINDNYF